MLLLYGYFTRKNFLVDKIAKKTVEECILVIRWHITLAYCQKYTPTDCFFDDFAQAGLQYTLAWACVGECLAHIISTSSEGLFLEVGGTLAVHHSYLYY